MRRKKYLFHKIRVFIIQVCLQIIQTQMCYLHSTSLTKSHFVCGSTMLFKHYIANDATSSFVSRHTQYYFNVTYCKHLTNNNMYYMHMYNYEFNKNMTSLYVKYTPFWDLLMLQLMRPAFPKLPYLFSTFHLEYPSVLSRLCPLQ